jgi:uncharacterized RDD family membrane protein YckC
MIFLTKHKQGLHDLIAKTIVQETWKEPTTPGLRGRL